MIRAKGIAMHYEERPSNYSEYHGLISLLNGVQLLKKRIISFKSSTQLYIFQLFHILSGYENKKEEVCVQIF